MVLAKIIIKHGRSSSVRGVATYTYLGLLCAVYSVRVSCTGMYVHGAMIKLVNAVKIAVRVME